MPQVTRRSHLGGLRWAGIREFLEDTAAASGTTVTVTERDKGLLRETIHFEVCGEEARVAQFFRAFHASVTAYNKE